MIMASHTTDISPSSVVHSENPSCSDPSDHHHYQEQQQQHSHHEEYNESSEAIDAMLAEYLLYESHGSSVAYALNLDESSLSCSSQQQHQYQQQPSQQSREARISSEHSESGASSSSSAHLASSSSLSTSTTNTTQQSSSSSTNSSSFQSFHPFVPLSASPHQHIPVLQGSVPNPMRSEAHWNAQAQEQQYKHQHQQQEQQRQQHLQQHQQQQQHPARAVTVARSSISISTSNTSSITSNSNSQPNVSNVPESTNSGGGAISFNPAIHVTKSRLTKRLLGVMQQQQQQQQQQPVVETEPTAPAVNPPPPPALPPTTISPPSAAVKPHVVETGASTTAPAPPAVMTAMPTMQHMPTPVTTTSTMTTQPPTKKQRVNKRTAVVRINHKNTTVTAVPPIPKSQLVSINYNNHMARVIPEIKLEEDEGAAGEKKVGLAAISLSPTPENMDFLGEDEDDLEDGEDEEGSKKGGRKLVGPCTVQAERRRERNRVLAKKSRQKKKNLFETLQVENSRLNRENQILKSLIRSQLKIADADLDNMVKKELERGGYGGERTDSFNAQMMMADFVEP